MIRASSRTNNRWLVHLQHTQLLSGRICSRFGLPDLERMARTISRPSQTTFFSESREAIARQGPQAMLGSWLKQVSQEELKEIQEILDVSGIQASRCSLPIQGADLCPLDPLAGGTR